MARSEKPMLDGVRTTLLMLVVYAAGGCGDRSLGKATAEGGRAGAATAGSAGGGSGGTVAPPGPGEAGASPSGTGPGTAGATDPSGAAGSVASGAAGSMDPSGAAGSPDFSGAAGSPDFSGAAGFVGVLGAAGSSGEPSGAAGQGGASGAAGQGGASGCAPALCGQANCAAGFHAEIPDGQCCPTCVMDVSAACQQARAAYARDRVKVLEPDVPCQVDNDCWFIFEQNACVNTCPVARSVTTFQLFQAAVGDDARACDASCPPLPPPTTCGHVKSICSGGQCTTAMESG
jgi:hypothetical protein